MIVLPLGALGVPSSPRLLLLVLFLFFCGRRGSPSTLRRPFWPPPRPPRFPQGPFREPKCAILYSKTYDFAGPPVCPKLSPRVPDRPPKAPQGPQRSPQGCPRDPQGSPKGSTQGPAVHPRSPRGTPGPHKVTPSLPKSSQRTAKVPQSNLLSCTSCVPVLGALASRGGGAFLTDVLSCTGSVRADAEP